VLVGHTEGLTNVSAKGDGRYVISNGKDQALRLWDLRYMRSSAEFDAYRFPSFSDPHFDYRYGNLPRSQHAAHPKDCSVMTYRGHQVLQTLIRCNFSPNETTGGRYIYSGSSDGRIHVSFRHYQRLSMRMTLMGIADLVTRWSRRASAGSQEGFASGIRSI
jgi:WD repeat-containing protein 23